MAPTIRTVWTVGRVEARLQYTIDCPADLNPARWRAMMINAAAESYREFFKTVCNPYSDLPF